MPKKKRIVKKRIKIEPWLILVSIIINLLLFLFLLYDLQYTKIGVEEGLEKNPLLSQQSTTVKFYLTYLVPLILFIGSLYYPKAILFSLLLFLVFLGGFINNIETLVSQYHTDYDCVINFFVNKNNLDALFIKEVHGNFSAYVDSSCTRTIPPSLAPEICTLPPGLTCLDFSYSKIKGIQLLIQNKAGSVLKNLSLALNGTGCKTAAIPSDLLSEQRITYLFPCSPPSGQFRGELLLSHTNQTGQLVLNIP